MCLAHALQGGSEAELVQQRLLGAHASRRALQLATPHDDAHEAARNIAPPARSVRALGMRRIAAAEYDLPETQLLLTMPDGPLRRNKQLYDAGHPAVRPKSHCTSPAR